MVCCIALTVLCATHQTASGEQATVLTRGQWKDQPVRTLADLTDFRPAQPALNQYGGWADGPQLEATGFFRTQRVDGRWWMVDPEGRLFLSVGICSVNADEKALSRTPIGSLPNWAKTTHDLLRANGVNTLGCWSDWGAFTGDQRLPYTRRWNFMSTFGRKLKVTGAGFGHTQYHKDAMPLFHPDFESFCDEHAKQMAETKDDPWLIGHFSDNELPLRPNLLNIYLAQPEDDNGYRAAKAWWDKRRREQGYAEGQEPGTADQDAFLTFAAKRYYETVGAAIKKYDPNHMYLGSRVHGACIRPATFRGSTAVDIVSVNYYHRWTPEPDRISAWAEASGRPILVSEWYAMALPDADPKVSGAGFRVQTHEDRGLFYQNFALGLLEHPDCVGWHWFKYRPDQERKQIGIVDQDYQPYEALLSSMMQLNQQVYPLATYFEAGRPAR